jgi:DNA-binding NtrC family response regulator
MSQKTILVVDDERALADSMTAILQQSGYNAIAAYNAAEAQQTLRTNTVDLMISDVIMPGMNGFELALYTNRNYPGTAVLLISGNAATQQILTAHGNEAQQFALLSKPILPKQMLAHVEALLGHRPLKQVKSEEGKSSGNADSWQIGRKQDSQ